MPPLKPTRGILLNKSHPLARGLVGCWLYNEGAGGKVFDLSGNGKNGVLVGDPAWLAGRHGSALDFDGSGDYVDLGDAVTDISAPLTIVAWFKTTDLTSYQSLFQVCDSSSSAMWFELELRGTVTSPYRRVIAWARDTGGNIGEAKSTAEYISDRWHMATGVFVSSTLRYAYLDDGNAGSNSDTSTPTGLDTTTIAYNRDSTPGQIFTGQIGHVMIWNRALSAAEIAWLYREPFCMFGKAIRPKLIGSPIVYLVASSVALSSLSATAKAIRKVGGTVASQSVITALLKSICGEEASLEIERSWLREALFNGMTANAFKLGTTLSLGWFWVRVVGCSVLYRGPSMQGIDFANILIVAEQNACEISPPTYISHKSSSTYFYVIRRFNNCGYQELTLAAAVKVSINASGDLEKPQPNNIFSSEAEQVDGNKIQLIWFYCPLEQKSQPVCFDVYYDGGMGLIDYENPLAKISYEGQRFYSYQSGALGAGGYLFTIRAEDADGIENSSSAQLKIQLDTTNPDAIDILSTEIV